MTSFQLNQHMAVFPEAFCTAAGMASWRLRKALGAFQENYEELTSSVIQRRAVLFAKWELSCLLALQKNCCRPGNHSSGDCSRNGLSGHLGSQLEDI